ncbi:chain-length determining protein [Cyanobium sp. ATX 6A2]|nr:chain-length determining protein [Cyanobium sp. ATX 6A2]
MPLTAYPSGPESEQGGFNAALLLRILRRRKRWFAITFLLLAGLQVGRTLHQRITSPVFSGAFTLLITDPVNDPTRGQSAEEGGAIASLARNTATADLPTLIQVLQSRAVLEPVFDQLRAEGAENSDLPRIGVGLVTPDAVSRELGSPWGVLEVRGRGTDRQLLELGLQRTEQAYLAWATSQRQERLSDGLRFLEEQEPRLQANSNALQNDLQRFRETNTLIAPTEEALALRAQLEELNQRLLAQQGERQRLLDLQGDVAAGRLSARDFRIGGGGGQAALGVEGAGAGAGGGGELAANLPNQALLDELGRLEQEIAVAEANFQPGAKVLRSLTAARDKLLPELRAKQMDAVEAALRQNTNAIRTTGAQVSRLERQFQQQPELVREFEALQQRLQIADGNLESYLRTREQFQLEIAQRSTPWKVISSTQVSDIPVEPSLRRGLLQGLLLGLLGGTGVALVRDRMDHVFHTPREVREDLQAPLLGHIPFVEFFENVRRENRFLLDDLDRQTEGEGGYQRFYYQEALRNLYTSLRFLSTEKPLRSVGVTSSVPSEGKSLLNVLLAKTLSELGQRVLLVDADLRKPQIHHRLGLDNLRGLSNLLTDENLDWRVLVQTLPNSPSWHVLTAGQLPPDPPRLLGSERMGQLVETLAASGDFDLILYDTRPALGLADAALTAQHLDGILLLVSLNRVDRALPLQVVERIREAGAPLLGVVTNSCRRSSERDSSLGYGYGSYRYGSYRSYASSGASAEDDSASPLQRLRRWFSR